MLVPNRHLFPSETVTSPNGRIQVSCNLFLNPRPYPGDLRLYYRVYVDGVPVLRDSPLGLEFANQSPLVRDFRIYQVRRSQTDETFSLVCGPQNQVRNQYNEITLRLQEKDPPFRLLDVTFRVFNDGVAFRYRIPRQQNVRHCQITREATGFFMDADVTAYPLILDGYDTPYETNYQAMPLSRVSSQSLIALPLLMDTGRGIWMAVTEAALKDYAGMYLGTESYIPMALTARLSPQPADTTVKVTGECPLTTPWRVILLANEPARLIDSDLIVCLNPPCAIDDPSWIRPGKCAWPWWSGRWVEGVPFQGGMNTETMLHYLDFAAEAGLEYLLIDALWYGDHTSRDEDITTPIPQVDLPRILEAGKRRGVGIFLWLNWMCVEDQIDRAFPLYEKWGVAGVKVDYMNRDDQDMVAFYHRVVEKAARHHLLVDFHGAYKPTGIRRTFPNLITREGVLGLEWSKWSRKCDPEHELTIPFTRMLAGPMDFTPGCFRTVMESRFEPNVAPPRAMGTRCHQLAMYVVYDSPLQMCVDYPGAYRNQPGLDFLMAVPASWDTSVVLNGRVGDFITVARRSGDVWYLGAMTDGSPRQLYLSLEFLEEGTYEAELYTDAPDDSTDPAGVITRKQTVTPRDRIMAVMASGGGFAAVFRPVNPSP
jgi:alpha-glucosidase